MSSNEVSLRNFLERYPHKDIANIGGMGDDKVYPDLKFDIYDKALKNLHDICLRPLPRRYQTIITLNTLEHIRDPIRAGEHIANSLNIGGYLFVSLPYLYHYHNYELIGPNHDGVVMDYYRFTEMGLRYVFRLLTPVETWYNEDNTNTIYGGVDNPTMKHNRINSVFRRDV